MNNKKPSLNVTENPTEVNVPVVETVSYHHKNCEKKCKPIHGLNLFLWWYFIVLSGSFVIALLYNIVIAKVNVNLENPIQYIDISNIVLIVTTALGTGLGVVLSKISNPKE